MPSDKRYTLGIDIGTTTVKVALLDTLTTKVLQTKCRETHAHVNSNLGKWIADHYFSVVVHFI